MSQSTADTDQSQLVRKYVGARLELNGYIARGLHGLPGMCLLGKEHKAARYIFISFRQTLPRTPFPQSYLGGEKQEEKVVNGKDTRRDYARLCDKQFDSIHTKECRRTTADEATRPAPSPSIQHICVLYIGVYVPMEYTCSASLVGLAGMDLQQPSCKAAGFGTS